LEAEEIIVHSKFQAGMRADKRLIQLPSQCVENTADLIARKLKLQRCAAALRQAPSSVPALWSLVTVPTLAFSTIAQASAQF
jgi:hypothetical protein